MIYKVYMRKFAINMHIISSFRNINVNILMYLFFIFLVSLFFKKGSCCEYAFFVFVHISDDFLRINS